MRSILELIGNITSQNNLLALNATIESVVPASVERIQFERLRKAKASFLLLPQVILECLTPQLPLKGAAQHCHRNSAQIAQASSRRHQRAYL
jgi:hypothetical protein